jgi:hypothetical protein
VLRHLLLLLLVTTTGAGACTLPPGWKEDDKTRKSTQTLTVLGKTLQCQYDQNEATTSFPLGYGKTTYICEGTRVTMTFHDREPYTSFRVVDKAGNSYLDSAFVNPFDKIKPERTDTCTGNTRIKRTVYQFKTGGSTPMQFVFTTVNEIKFVPFTPTF